MLTDEDKRWIENVLGALEARFDEKLATQLAALERRFDEKLASQLGALERRFDEKLASQLGALERRFDEKLAALETRFDEKLERVETRLLTEFHKWASPAERRMRGMSQMVLALDERVSNIEDRIQKLERHQ